MDVEYSNEFKRDRDFYSGDNELMRQIAGKIKEIKKVNSIEGVQGMDEIRDRIYIKMLHKKVWVTIIDTYKKRFYERI